MIFEARSSLRRCTTVTVSPNLVRKMASSRAESPPPITAMCLPRKKNPSQVAHVDTPRLSRRCSAGRPSISDRAPVDTITEPAWCSTSSPVEGSGAQTRKGRAEKSTR